MIHTIKGATILFILCLVTIVVLYAINTVWSNVSILLIFSFYIITMVGFAKYSEGLRKASEKRYLEAKEELNKEFERISGK